MKLPTREQCLAYFEQYHVPKNIKEHCVAVEDVSLFLAKRMNDTNKESNKKIISSKKKKLQINIEQVSRLALLHDLFKAVALDITIPNPYHPYTFSSEEIASWKLLREKFPNKHESEVAYEILRGDFPEFAASLKNVGNGLNEDKSFEETIVSYADWRVLGTKIVSVSERNAYLFQRYPQNRILLERSIILINRIEQELFSLLTFTSEKLLTEMLKSSSINDAKMNTN
ncbi:hypothetical protein HYX12_03630 [Candidatus Woesearchaeota archaeon]|nr:hypothetical protein [Candidatus Woesearchaeota archaeon]